MTDGDEKPGSTTPGSESRPVTAHKDDDDNNKRFESIPYRQRNATNTHSQTPGAELIPDSSMVEGMTFDDTRHGDSVAESAVRAHLQDVESSFISRLSPLPSQTQNGADDTYLFDGARPQKKPQSTEHDDESFSTQDDPLNELPPLRPQDSISADVSNTTSSLEAFSSPTAAASRRTVSRALSGLSNDPRRTSSYNLARPNESMDDDRSPADLSMSQSDASQSSSSLRRQKSDQNLGAGSVDAGSTPGHALRYGKRPRFLRSRGASQRSSTSSFIMDPESQDDLESDVTVGLDEALQSGSIGPTMPRGLSNMLSRSVSIGSMASGIDDATETGPAILETLEEQDSPQRRAHHDEDLVKTPKASKDSLSAPTDTVIARHVRNVHVPESLAKEYKTKTGLATPRKPSEMTLVGTSRSGRNLTLKEQSSTIERLSKENFDLKLKVMFLSDRLDKLSEEGVKEMISENVELKTTLAVVQRDNKALRRRVKELEKKLKDDEGRPSTARSGASSNDQTAHFFDQEAHEREEELIYLRERVEEYIVEIERLKTDSMSKEAEKRKLADMVKSLGERTGENLGRQEEADVWKDLLEQETARREQADEEIKRLRDENFRYKQDLTSGGHGGLHHTTNIYNITKKNRNVSPSRPVSGITGTTLLRHENVELRREVGAQTSMLTSRNREKDRLYQEIEELKLAQRRGGPAHSTVDSILERSASRAGVHQRSMSRASASRTQLETKLSEARDRINELQEEAVDGKRAAEELAQALQEELQAAENDLVALQAERDDALREHADTEEQFEALRKEAQDEIDALEAEADQRNEAIQHRSENFDALQEEMRKMSEALENKLQRIQQLEKFVKTLRESNDKVERLTGEIGFLREEQEGDKIRIGDLEAEIQAAEQSLQEEKDRERRQREVVANQEKEEVQQFMSAAKDDLSSREERLHELESNLREALGDLNGTRSSLLRNIANLQRELENTIRELDTTKASLQRDSLLETHGLESRRLSDLLNKEQQAHRTTRSQYETFQKTHHHVSRTELEAGRAQDKKRIAQLEGGLRDQVTERNNLLLVLWTRLLINGRALPSLESNLLAAVKTIEAMLGSFQSRIKEGTLEQRCKKLDRLEAIVRNGVATGSLNSHDHSRMLKVENATLRTAQDGTLIPEIGGSPSPSIPTGPRDRERKYTKRSKGTDAGAERPGTLSRLNSSASGGSGGGGGNPFETALVERNSAGAGSGGSGGGGPGEEKAWMLRLRDLEMKLKAEREGRTQDRASARQRLGGLETENRDLRGEMVRMRRAGRGD
ncbi:anucleate primary sterigmata protein B [Plectosphaerella plurivora]|uniref:Anucleate primary sterigmata protein B n=1 Tax=Plectosphaerella plurivora TaxID=936078 RepID=A0A9P8V4J9_9PEZI|nr:anucleate primary sterigmata protein B [Plectosphaerella plurivora]